ncbi:peptidase M24 [Chloroflexota bacterium]|nr:peptidase M24 [Chloroflexota bacterium]
MSYWTHRDAVRVLMAAQGVTGWLLMDFRGNNPLFAQTLGRGASGGHLTRRTFAWLPADPHAREVVIAHAIESSAMDDPRWEVRTYHDAASLRGQLSALGPGGTLAGAQVAMEYSPGGGLPYVSRVDGGTIDMMRELGANVVTSADLLQVAIAQWDETQIAQHDTAARLVDDAKNAAFALVAERLRAGGTIDEFEVQQFIVDHFASNDLVSVYRPTVAVGPNSANSHYEPLAHTALPIKRDSWLLIDLWARMNIPGSPFADVTWVAWTGPSPVPTRIREVFDVVKSARDLALIRLEGAAKAGRVPQGWEIDRAVRDHIEEAGYGPYFTHRTGHNLGPEEVHGSAGVCLDDFETHDTRLVLSDVAFSVEPGIYLRGDFGVRLELNAVMGPQGARVYTPVQDDIIVLLK